MKQVTQNSFNKGMLKDLSFINTPNDLYIDALNATLITKDGNEFILQNEKGNELVTSLSNGFICLAVEAYNGIAYFVSFNPTTNEGEIGTFPSPDYENTIVDGSSETGNLLNKYTPLNNFTGEEIIDNTNLIPFTTDLFNFNLKKPGELEIQPSYDGTVNLVFTDNENPVRIINSRFRVLPANRFEIIDRKGTKDVNIYSNATFEQTALILNSTELVDLQFNRVFNGGRLPAGGFKYYFKYVNQDGNVTDVIEESFLVSVFFGDKPSNIRGGQPNEPTNKQVSFTLNNIDTTFNAVRLYYSYLSAGKDETTIPLIFQLENDFIIGQNESIQITHTGFEDSASITEDELNIKYSIVSTAKSISQIQGRLFLANVKQESNLDSVLEVLSLKIRIQDNTTKIEYPNDISDLGNIFQLPNNQSTNNGYWNPDNIYNRLGYWDEETYGFGIVYILNDGSTTSVFPIEGAVNGDYTGILDENNNFFNDDTGRNNLGIYRFIGNEESTTVNSHNIRSVEFNFNNFTTVDFEKIKSITKGCFFVRTDRFKNVIGEAMIVPCARHPNGNGDNDLNYGNQTNDGAGASSPLPFGHLENCFKGNGSNDPVPLVYYNVSLDGSKKFTTDEEPKYAKYDSNRFALIIPDLNTTEAITNGQLNSNVFLKLISEYSYKTDSFYSHRDGITFNLPTMYSPLSINQTVIKQYFENETFEVEPVFIGRGQTTTTAGFSGIFVGEDTRQNDQQFALTHEPYIGIRKVDGSSFKEGIPTSSISSFIHEQLEVLKNTINTIKNVLNLGSNGDTVRSIFRKDQINQIKNIAQTGILKTRILTTKNPYKITTLKSRTQNINGNSYYSITNRLSWNKIENNLNKVETFRGDCYKNIVLKRIYSSPEFPLDPTKTTTNSDTNILGTFDFKVGREIGYLMGMSISSDTNHYLKDEYLFDINETVLHGGQERWFYPYSFRNTTEQDFSDVVIPDINTDVKTVAVRMGRFKLAESTLYNNGYSFTKSNIINVPIAVNTPFQQTRFDSRVYYSNIFVNNNFANGYRNVSGLSYRDYSRHLGEIVKIVNVNNQLIMVQENGISILGVNDRSIIGNDISGSIFVDQSGVLHPKPYYLSESYGSRWQWSIKKSTNFLYGVDIENNVIWKTSGKNLETISTFNIQSLLNDEFESYRNGETDLTNIDVVTHFNKLKNDVIFTFYNKNENKSLNIVYNEIMGKWISRVSFTGYKSFNIYDSFYTLNVDSSQKIWEHDSNNVPTCNFYGKQHTFEYEYVIVENSSIQKMINNIKIISNNSIPIQVLYNTDNDLDILQNTVERNNNNILSYDVTYKENHVYLTVLKNKQKRIRDKYIRVRIIYKGSDYTFIQALQNFITYSYS